MKELLNKILDKLKDASKIAFMGIGEEKLADDAVGIYIISELLKYSNDKFLFINAGIDPMGRIDDIIEFQSSHLVLLDTCTLDKPPGTIAIIERENIHEYVPISSHTIPIHIVIDLLSEKLPGINVFMIGFVPESLEGFKELMLFKKRTLSLENIDKNIELPFFNIQLTETIHQAADNVIIIIKEVMKLL